MLSEYRTTEKFAKQCMQCTGNNLLLIDYEWNCISCGYNGIKRENEHTRVQRKEINFYY